MTSYLLDTNVAVALTKRRPLSVSERYVEVTTGGATVAISSISLFELHYGAERSPKRDQFDIGITKLLSGSTEIVPFDEEDAVAAGAVRAALERKGKPIGPYDTLIAAQALRRGLILVTDNLREFKRVPHLSVESWQ